VVDVSSDKRAGDKVKITTIKKGPDNFAITDQVLLLFNEHDTKIALNWQTLSEDLPPRKGTTS
jgi:hypothetical protein